MVNVGMETDTNDRFTKCLEHLNLHGRDLRRLEVLVCPIRVQDSL